MCQVSLAEVRDHVIPLAEGGEDTEDNTQPLCILCHDQKTRQESLRGQTRGLGMSQPSPTRVVVTGPPGAGKTTWVQQRAKPGDIVFDFDAIANLVAQEPTWPRSEPVTKAVLAMRDGLTRWLATSPLLPLQVYIIVSHPAEAQQVVMQIGGQVVDVRTQGGG
jgi:hypothetical protein